MADPQLEFDLTDDSEQRLFVKEARRLLKKVARKRRLEAKREAAIKAAHEDERKFARERLHKSYEPLREGYSEPKARDDDVPTMVARVQVEIERSGKSYEEANWPKLSPMFRRAHNRLRVLRGLSPFPEPKIDLWLPAPVREISKFDSNNKEFIASAREFLGPRMMGGGAEGFTDKGSG